MKKKNSSKSKIIKKKKQIKDMSKQNRKLIVLLSILAIATFGVSLAFFGNEFSQLSESSSATASTTTTTSGSTIAVEGKVEFDDTDIYPGHRNLAMIKVTGTSKNGTELVAYNVIWSGTNGLSTPLNYNIYKVNSEVANVSVTCEKTTGMQGKSKIYYETCENNNFTNLGEVVASGTISGNKATLITDEFINATTSGTVVYYYLVVEYPNLNSNQNIDMGKTFSGELTIEQSSARDIPGIEINEATVIEGSNDWYTFVSLNVNGTNEHAASGVTSISYCVTTDNTCSPNTVVNGSTTIVPLTSNASGQKVCATATSSHNVVSGVTCSNVYQVDAEEPSIAYNIDSSTSGDNGWYKSLSINTSGTTNNSPIASINYCITTSSSCEPDTLVNSSSTVIPLTSNVNAQKICAEATNAVGTTGSVVCSSSYYVDGVSPTISISSTTSTHDTITVNVSTNDDHSGEETYYYSINNGLYQTSSDSSYVFDNLSAGDSYTVSAYVLDEAGNESTIASTSVNTKPSGTITISSSTGGSNGWYKALTLGISGTSESTITSIDYCVTTSSDCTPDTTVNESSTTVTLTSNESAQKICATLTNSNGTTSSKTCSTAYSVDTEGPNQTITIVSSTTGDNDWYKALTVKADGIDSHSQVASMKYCTTTSTTCTPNIAYTNGSNVSFTNNASAQRICFNTTDIAGWTSTTTCSDTYQVDGLAPGVSIEVTSTGDNITVTQTTTEAHSQVATYNYKIGTGSYTSSSTNTNTYSSLTANSYTVYATATDNAGNTTGTAGSQTLYKVTASVSGGTATPSVKYAVSGGSATFTISASSGYDLSGATVSGTNCSLNSTKTTLTASSVTAARTCTVTIPVSGTEAKTAILANNTATTSCSGMTIQSNEIKATIKSYSSKNQLCKMKDGMYTTGGTYGDGYTYIFRGAVNNNWVKFAGKYWRIIRVNGDGSIRMIYTGTTAPTSSTAIAMTGNGTQLTTSAFNTSASYNEYAGWKYGDDGHGTDESSTIRTYLVGENGSSGWYSSSGLSSYASYLADGKFCNDRTTSSGTGIGVTATRYAAYSRSSGSSITATTSCSASADIFTEKVGLITYDEVMFAGSTLSYNTASDETLSNFYLYTARDYWTMTPRRSYENDGAFRVMGIYVDSKGHTADRMVSVMFGIRPVINLKAGTKFKSGNGTYNNVYKVSGTND